MRANRLLPREIARALPHEIERLRPLARSLSQEIERLRARQPARPGSAALRNAGVGAAAVGALALGAFAIGALAIGAFAVGRLSVRKARFQSLEIDELTVRRLRMPDPRAARRLVAATRGAPALSVASPPLGDESQSRD
ncbi:MAG TPA: hypothetical protein VFY53_02660 [Rhodoplanes sp.]|jgi:hypothetical protein|nr:hypothetical protein [Rhodoplanes sp.]